jgi:N-acetylglucosaminyl-diphospho-decaprenol L-rhamnosyltransferase
MAIADPRVAVVIATRDRADLLSETLARLAALPERPRVVIVDNGSSDRTAEVVRAAGVELVALGENRGAAARNLGVRLAPTPVVAFADDDSWYTPGSLSLAADLFDMHPHLGLIAARVLVGLSEELDPTCAAMAASPLPAAPGLPGLAVLGFLACGAVVRRSAFLAVGGFSDRFGVGGEEELLALDLAAAGWELVYVDRVTAHHHPPPRSDLGSRRRILVRNALWSAWMRRRAAGVMRRTVRLVRDGLSDATSRAGIFDAIRGLPGVLRDRRPVPPRLESLLRLID